MVKIKFTSKKHQKPNKLERAFGIEVSLQHCSMKVYWLSLRCESDNFMCEPKNVLLRLKFPEDHRYAVNYVKRQY